MLTASLSQELRLPERYQLQTSIMFLGRADLSCSSAEQTYHVPRQQTSHAPWQSRLILLLGRADLLCSSAADFSCSSAEQTSHAPR